jgi:protein-disulfide isomerase
MPNGSRLETAAITILAVCALVITVTVVRHEFMPPRNEATPRAPTEVKDWSSYAVGDMRIGPLNAPVTIVEFSDFECPYCGRLFPVLTKVLVNHPNDVQLVYRNFPLQGLHPNARAAALAAECAASQGKFNEYQTVLFQHQDSLGKIPWSTFATRAGVKQPAAFDACLTSSRTLAELRSDSLAGEALHIIGTPTVLVNKWMLNETPTFDVLEKFIAQSLSNAKPRT